MDELDTLLQTAGVGFEIDVDVVVQAVEPSGGNQPAGIVVGKAGTATTDPAEIAASFKLEAETRNA